MPAQFRYAPEIPRRFPQLRSRARLPGEIAAIRAAAAVTEMEPL